MTSSTTILPPDNANAWDIMMAFAHGTINSLPETEEKLKNCLGNQFIFADWKPAFDAILAAEDDTPAAVAAIDSLRTTPV
jgi:hypothetical protein